MIAHTDDGFRKTGIWLIAETGDLRFLPVQARLMKESTPALRPYVFRAFAKLKQKRSRLAALPALRLYALRGKSQTEGFREIHIMPLSPAGHPIAGLKATDGWMMLKYCRSEGPEVDFTPDESAAKLRFILDSAAAENAIKIRKPRLSSSRSLLHAVRSLIAAMSRGRGRRHLIVLDDGSCPAPDAGVLREIMGAARGTEITIHAVSPRQKLYRARPRRSNPAGLLIRRWRRSRRGRGRLCRSLRLVRA